MGATINDSRIRWPHTGIEAPYRFTITGLTESQTNCGVAYSTELFHPDLGSVGLIANEGFGGPTTFYPHDELRFGERQLKKFLECTLQDEEPMNTGPAGLEFLLDDIITESETDRVVSEMRTRDLFLVRSFLSRDAASWGPQRGEPLPYSRILTRRDDRKRLAAKLAADPATRLDKGCYWQMFNGEDWVRLLGPSPLASEPISDRVQRPSRLAAESKSPDTDNRVPFDEFTVFGTPTAGFTLVGDHHGELETTKWCRCSTRQSVIAFERWNKGSLQESGAVHAPLSCRSLVRIA